MSVFWSSPGWMLVGWIALGVPAAVGTLRLDRRAAAIVVGLTGPLSWLAWVLARRHDHQIRISTVARDLRV